MYKSHRSMLALSLLCALLISTPIRADNPRNRTREEPAKPAVAAQLHFEVVELRLDADQLQQIDQAEGPIDLDAMALDAIKAKKARVLYTIDTPVVVGDGAKLQTSTTTPLISGVVKNDGESVKQLSRENVGCELDIQSRWIDQEESSSFVVHWSIDLRSKIPVPNVELDEGISARADVAIRQNSQSICKIGECISTSTLTGHRAGTGPEATGLAYVFHLCFHPIDDESGTESDDEPAAKPVSKSSA